MQNGKWSRAENLGAAVNTSGDESCPFMHADNETLYFNSNGHKGYGSTDLYMAKKVSDTSWQMAENLGYPINTIDDEGSLIVAADATTAYYASDRSDSKGGLDLYRFRLRKDIAPARTLWVRGQVFDKKTRGGLPSSLELTDIDKRIIISRLQTDEDGRYLVTLPVGHNYAFNVNRKGYLFYSDNFEVPYNASSVEKPFTRTIFLKKIPESKSITVTKPIVLKNVLFKTGSSTLLEASFIELAQLLILLKENPNIKIQINGHTDNIGSESANQVLSLNRAKAVYDYLIQNKADTNRISYKGFGMTKPLDTNDTEQGRQNNRRTEFEILSN